MTEIAPDPEFFATNPDDPYPTYAELRERCPVYQDPLSGAYCVSRYDDVVGIIGDPDRFSSRAHRLGALVAARRAGVDAGEIRRTAIVHDDGEYHDWLRDLIALSFTPRAIAEFTPRVDAIAAELLDGVQDGVAFDLYADYAGPLPASVIGAMYGVPSKDWPEFRGWTRDYLSPDPAIHGPASAAFSAYFLDLMHQRREAPGDDMISHLVGAQAEQPERLTDEEVLAVIWQNILAGNETTAHLIVNMVDHLIDRPELWARLREDRALVDATIEETLRVESPVQWMPRRVMTSGTEIDGVEIPEGATLVPMFGAANRDERRFEDGDTFDPDRRGAARHLAFGRGTHSCVGQALARLEAKVTLNRFLDRFASIERVGEPQRSQVFLGVRGFTSYPVVARRWPAAR